MGSYYILCSNYSMFIMDLICISRENIWKFNKWFLNFEFIGNSTSTNAVKKGNIYNGQLFCLIIPTLYTTWSVWPCGAICIEWDTPEKRLYLHNEYTVIKTQKNGSLTLSFSNDHHFGRMMQRECSCGRVQRMLNSHWTLDVFIVLVYANNFE